jgi:hypothetical protein
VRSGVYAVVARAAQALADAGCEGKLVREYLEECKGKPQADVLRITDEWLSLLAI